MMFRFLIKGMFVEIITYILSYNSDYIILKNNKNIFNKNEGRCRDVKTQKACEHGWEVNVGPKIKQTTSI